MPERAGGDGVGIRELLRGIPRFLVLLGRLLRDPRVSATDKALLAAAVAYAVTPLDLMPDFLPLLGQLDDLFFVALAVERLVASAGPELVQAHWDGSQAVLGALSGSLADLARRLPEPVRRRLVEEAGSR